MGEFEWVVSVLEWERERERAVERKEDPSLQLAQSMPSEKVCESDDRGALVGTKRWAGYAKKIT